MSSERHALLHRYKIQGPAGPLEVLYRAAPEGAHSRGAAVVCHPHPLHGGTMHTRLVFHLARALHEAGFATLRFNFRGVGLSGGVYDGGAGERGDVRAALEHLSGRHPAGPLVVAGHSFGAWVGLQVGMSDSRVRQLVGVGIPIKTYDFGFLEGAGKDILFIQGDRDRFGAASEVEALAARVAGTAVILPGGEHLLEGHLGELRRVILERLPETGSGQST